MTHLPSAGFLLAAPLALGLTAGAALAAEPLVSTSWLKANLDNPQLVILDVRNKLAQSGREDYLKAHIPGAIWSEYPGFWRTERDGVPGVLPSVEKLEASLSELGISEGEHVVIYPAGNSATDFGVAARLYWTFKYLGHEEVSILDGGWKAWSTDAANPVEAGNVVPQGDMFIADINEGLAISTSDVSARLGSDTTFLDARPEAQFLGKEKHGEAARFGRLPGAVNADNHGFYDAAAGRIRPVGELASLVPASIAPDSAIVSYCNTGHWAATNWFVLSELLGYSDVTLYDDSMVGWTADAANAIESDRTRLDDLKDWFNGFIGG